MGRQGTPAAGVCEYPGCDRPRWSRGYCASHYTKLHKAGALPTVRHADPSVRFDERVHRNGPVPEHRPDLGPCWLWTGALSAGTGYPRFAWEGRNRHAHVYAYERWVGPIPEGHELDHLCRRPACVNPTHLEAVTHRENVLRGRGVSAVHAAKTTCPRGHPYDRTTPNGRRRCSTCDNALRRARRLR